MQGENVQINEIIQLAALVLMMGSVTFLGKVFPPGRSNGNPGKPPEQAELLKKFAELNPEAQRGAIRYIDEMRKGYKKLDK
ncbi:hypothetical protein ES707_13075 [subsurface metagenome]